MPDSPPQHETITYERRGRVGLITLNRPEKLNAWNPRMESEVIDCVTRAAGDPRGTAATTGPAIGIGLTMPLACDIRIASERATFSARFVKVGITPECGSTRYLPAVAGLGNALCLALTGRIIEAAEAKERGLVDRVVSHDSLMNEALALADEIAANPNDAVWAAKRLIHA